ncbi:hypothetical protein Dimus_020685 [Dionaea muscipula]
MGVEELWVGIPTQTDGEVGLPATVSVGQSQIPLLAMDSDRDFCTALEMDNPLAVFSNMPVADPYCSSVIPLLGVGLVSEEGRVLPTTKEALRPQPTDGLRQPPSSSVKPVIGVEGGVGQDGRCGGRSYAYVVQVDRRADVELSYLTPVDVGNTIVIEESDGDTL